MTEDIITAWDALAQCLCDEKGELLADARDAVIVMWLEKGDTRPFYDWVLRGHEPSSGVVRMIAAMMAKADSPDVLPATIRSGLSCGLSITGKKRGDRSNPENDARDYFIYRDVARKIASGGGYEAAIAAVHEGLPRIGINIGRQSVRDAYDKRHRRKNLKQQNQGS
ncbi:conserved hypothetical protein [Mesorhizobium prunaredense]|uniref:Uncharacterized protein n=1 Tax=Mesorhizobium prunaredense TaxID=1631249 RepID=A0A1R3VFT9_9HYPH|nr:hypothetical protein [Mesorhizobium prunaredense]SIT58782.1 conserved hypothetical protein [Mesorhizobium prunaredense]